MGSGVSQALADVVGITVLTVLGGAIGLLTSAIPDKLEPAKGRGRYHRSFFHSWILGISLALAGLLLHVGRLGIDPLWGVLIHPALAGYVSHLLLDWLTSPDGLPFLR